MSGRITGLSSTVTRHTLADLAEEDERDKRKRIDSDRWRRRGGDAGADRGTDGRRRAGVEGHGGSGGRGPTRQRQHKGFRVIGVSRSRSPLARRDLKSRARAVRQAMLEARRIRDPMGPSGDHLRRCARNGG